MIPAAKHPVIESVFTLINTSMLRRAFNTLQVRGEEYVRSLDRSRPIIMYGNHSNWWDGLIEFYLSQRVFRFDSFAMMDEEQMKRYRFFRWIGAFSVNRRSPRQALESLRYAIELFNAPNRVLWIYPQGVMRPNDVRPLAFEHGVIRVARSLPNPQLVPVAHRYEFVAQQRPEAFVSFGPSLSLPAGDRFEDQARDLESILISELDALRAVITSERFEQFRVVLRGRRSTNLSYDAFRQKERI